MQKNANNTTTVRLRRLTLFSSGVGFYQHSGEVAGNQELMLSFNKDAVNDALKSLAISDPDASPTVSYHSENTLQRTMKGLAIDLQGNNHVAALLNSMKGAEIEINGTDLLKGRIMLVEQRSGSSRNENKQQEAFLTLLTAQGIRIISLNEIRGFAFTDSKIQADANRALDLIMQSRASDIRNLTINLPGTKERKVSLSYVVPTPVWKVSYRLDLSQEKPFLQGWAIVDNDSDTDWDDVELSLVTGRPVSFIQELYAPYHQYRPTLPLAIAGIAEAKIYESDTVMEKERPNSQKVFESTRVCDRLEPESKRKSLMSDALQMEYKEEVMDLLSSGKVETALGREAGEQFEYTIRNSVNLPRQQSAMLPLVEGEVDVEKTLVFSANRTDEDEPMHPSVGAALINNIGMKLPAGPVTVYDSGTYAGDALIGFFPEGEKRIISYGEDLSVTGIFTDSSKHTISAASIKGGVLSIKQTQKDERVYTFRNSSSETKRLMVEHPIQSNAQLVEPSEYAEKTHNMYRFELQLAPGETKFLVKEERSILHEFAFDNMSQNRFMVYASNQELPNALREGLKRAVELKQATEREKQKLSDLQKRLQDLFKEQERTRRNLEAVGAQTQQGQGYLNRLAATENDIDLIYAETTKTESSEKKAQQAYDEYISGLYFAE